VTHFQLPFKLTSFGSRVTPVLAALLSSLFLILSFPPYNLGWLGWIALVPLFLALAGKKAAHSFFLALLSGSLFFFMAFNWVFEVPRYTVLHHVLLNLYLGIYFGFFGVLFNFLGKRAGIAVALLASPFLWVLMEYLRSNMGFMAIPYAWLGYSQYLHQVFIQIASLAGGYGVSFLLVMVNAAIAAIISTLGSRSNAARRYPLQRPSVPGLYCLVSAAIALIAGTVYYGTKTLSEPIKGNSLRVSVIQGNIEQEKKWDQQHAPFIMQTYENLTRVALTDQPDLIVWPEAALPTSLTANLRLFNQIKTLAADSGKYLLLGTTTHQKFDKDEKVNFEYKNSAVLVDPDYHRKNQQYDKVRLLPFGEYLPYRNIIPWSWIHVPKIASNTKPGRKLTIFKLSDYRFGSPICWENIFPDLPRKFVKNGAQFLINITNEAWFGRSVGPQHYLISSVFRAVENRVFVIRCANTGISCFIDPCGRVLGRVTDDKDRDIFVRGSLTKPIIPLDSLTMYTKHGDWLVWFCAGVSIVLAGAAIWKSRSHAGHQV